MTRSGPYRALAPSLQPVDVSDADLAHEVRVFPVRFLDPTPSRVARQPQHRAEHLRDPDRPRLRRDHRRHALDERRVPGRAERNRLREHGRSPRDHTVQGLTGFQVRNAQTRHSVGFVGKQLEELLLQRHLGEEPIHLRVDLHIVSPEDTGGRQTWPEKDGAQKSGWEQAHTGQGGQCVLPGCRGGLSTSNRRPIMGSVKTPGVPGA